MPFNGCDPTMSTTSDAPRMCWECDKETGERVTVTLSVTSGRQVTVDLCDDCYQTRYLALLRELTEQPLESRRGPS